jgi:PTH1 family peptidyl-tRNA hydrolase
MTNQISLIVGLGNPGEKYEGTRHNIGFDLSLALMRSLGVSFKKRKGFNSIYWEGRFKGRNLLVQQPQTFMNLSGKAVAALAKSRKIAPSEIIVIYDDMDLPLGKIRIRKAGNSAGHRGVDSLIEELGTTKFPRLRIGIGHARDETIDYVLAGFEVDEQQILNEVFETSVNALTLSLARGLENAMNSFNSVSHELNDRNNVNSQES